MELWPAIIASPFSTRCTLMDALIIVCLAKSVHRRFVHWTIRRPLRSSLMRARQCVKVVWSDLAETTMSGYGKAHADRRGGSSRSCVRLLCVRRHCWRVAPSVSCNAGEGVQVSQGEGLGKGSVGKRIHTHEMEKESPCNGQGARRHTCLERPQAFAACWCRYSGLTRTGF
jgi:hypothetical protein